MLMDAAHIVYVDLTQKISSMKSFLITLIFCMALNFSFGQSFTDTAKTDIKLARELVFSRAEYMPEFRFGLRALADSLKQYLLQTTFEFKPVKIAVVLTVNKSGDITDVQMPETADNPPADLIKKSLLATSGMWIPAKQNEHIVPCYKKLLLRFSKDDLKIVNDK